MFLLIWLEGIYGEVVRGEMCFLVLIVEGFLDSGWDSIRVGLSSFYVDVNGIEGYSCRVLVVVVVWV